MLEDVSSRIAEFATNQQVTEKQNMESECSAKTTLVVLGLVAALGVSTLILIHGVSAHNHIESAIGLGGQAATLLLALYLKHKHSQAEKEAEIEERVKSPAYNTDT